MQVECNRCMCTSVYNQVAMATSDEEAQEDELLALASIYNEDVFEVTREDAKPGGQFSARLELPDNFCVQMDSSGKVVMP